MATKAVISLTTGLEDPEKVTVAFLVAVGAAESGRPTLMFQAKEAARLALQGVATGVACAGCPPLADLLARYEKAGGQYLVCTVCFNAKQLDKGDLLANANLGGSVQLWEWIGDDGATTFSPGGRRRPAARRAGAGWLPGADWAPNWPGQHGPITYRWPPIQLLRINLRAISPNPGDLHCAVSGEEQHQMRTQWLTGRCFTAAAGLVVMAGVLAGPGAATASAAVCQAWTGAQPQSPGALDNSLSSVTVLSPCDVWAVGADISGGAFQTLIEHWNGFSWAVADSPDPGSGNNFLNSVRAASATSIWAVGSASDGTVSETLIEHWNGTAWKAVPSPSPGSGFNALNGVRVVSARDAWAVGDYAGGNGTHNKTLILHWNGATWKRVPSPSPGGNGNDNDLFAVAASSARDAWAVGEIVTGTGIQTLILHWNGRRWARAASPGPGTINELLGVGAISASNAWAVGNTAAGTAQAQQTLVLHWNGRRWARVASPNPGGPAHDNRLYAIAAGSASSAWAVGTYQTATGQSSIVLRWNGRRWAHVNTPSTGTQNGLFGVAASSASNAWAVGAYSDGGPFQALALHCC